MTKKQIIMLLGRLNDELGSRGVKGEICLYGGTVMCLTYNARPSTKDVDAVFKPTRQIREAASRIAVKYNLKKDWLNDAVKGFLVKHAQKILFNWPYLKVYIPEPDYLLAMKTFASRVDATDKQDIIFLIKIMKLKTPKEVLDILEKYYPHKHIKPATQYFVEELFDR